MIEKWRGGAQVVYGQRKKRAGETAFKKLTASVYYQTLSRLTGGMVPRDTGDFRLVDKQVAFADLARAAFETERKLLKNVYLFDVYEGKNLETGKKSYALSTSLESR